MHCSRISFYAIWNRLEGKYYSKQSIWRYIIWCIDKSRQLVTDAEISIVIVSQTLGQSGFP